MKTKIKTVVGSKRNRISFWMCSLPVLLAAVFISAAPVINRDHPATDVSDTGSKAIQLALKKLKPVLSYPQTVERLYQKTGSRLIWIFPDTIKGQHVSDCYEDSQL
jgi:hypothetical protein